MYAWCTWFIFVETVPLRAGSLSAPDEYSVCEIGTRATREIDLFYIRGSKSEIYFDLFSLAAAVKICRDVAFNPPRGYTRWLILFRHSSSSVAQCILMNSIFDNFVWCNSRVALNQPAVFQSDPYAFQDDDPRLSLSNPLGVLASPRRVEDAQFGHTDDRLFVQHSYPA